MKKRTPAALRTAASIEDLRAEARRQIPRALFDYVDRGSYAEQTLQANRRDLDRLLLRQRVLVDVSKRSLGTTLLGEPVALPMALAPVGLCGLLHGDGEIHACRAAQAAGIPFTLSTLSIASIEDVAAAVEKPFWFQLYMWRDRGVTRSLIERAIAAKCSALVVTVDLQALAQRHADIRNGLTVPPRVTLRNALEIALRPRWALGVLRGKRRTFGNLAGHVPDADGVNGLTRWSNGQFDPGLSWADLDWIRGVWPGKLIVKGILNPDDAALAAQAGASAIVVSNHGGRQLDGTCSTIAALPPIRDRVGDTAELIVDGGIRSGQDVLRGLAAGARACMVGRAFVYGLAAAGQAGVTRAIRILGRELDVSMALCGVARAADIDRRHLMSPTPPDGRPGAVRALRQC
ncbi:L-lactate dehydrogenase [Azospirillum doebereinerae]|uniref:alpha-hydroxy acid oxidase n=1 Tax=Azospirillum doebereinerae TaxID=92933 RepID=UPI001EE61E94|nr:alpha-hydroxy acid oxidase [Azospirillum doebereinerae]MCG5242915.1 alpha-hydroxy-acid oxidizing protein [Azospirillum doebereinerae]